MAGVFLLFKYGLPSNVLEGTVLIIEEKQEEANKRSRINKKITIKSYIGLSLIGIGFLLQLIRSNLPFLKKYFL
jgi:hypothetical protein